MRAVQCACIRVSFAEQRSFLIIYLAIVSLLVGLEMFAWYLEFDPVSVFVFVDDDEVCVEKLEAFNFREDVFSCILRIADLKRFAAESAGCAVLRIDVF